jgi:hypothetical protein
MDGEELTVDPETITMPSAAHSPASSLAPPTQLRDRLSSPPFMPRTAVPFIDSTWQSSTTQGPPQTSSVERKKSVVVE